MMVHRKSPSEHIDFIKKLSSPNSSFFQREIVKTSKTWEKSNISNWKNECIKIY